MTTAFALFLITILNYFAAKATSERIDMLNERITELEKRASK